MHDLVADGRTLRFTVDDAALSRVVSTLAPADIHSLVVTPPTLEELFVHHYGGRERTVPAGDGPAPATPVGGAR